MSIPNQRGRAASTCPSLLTERMMSGERRGASQLKWDWRCAHTSICWMFSSGHGKYEKVLKEAKEKMEKNEQRDEAVVLGETTATELPMDDSSTVVRTAAALRGTCHPPAALIAHPTPAAGSCTSHRHLGPSWPCVIPASSQGVAQVAHLASVLLEAGVWVPSEHIHSSSSASLLPPTPELPQASRPVHRPFSCCICYLDE